VFISHGGGPLPLLGDPAHAELVACLQGMAANLPRPDAIVVISAHWEAAVPTVTGKSDPPLVYDYYGFPPESYEIRYPCAGQPELARELVRALGDSGMPAQLDESRGLDHGVFVPLKIMYPDAGIPCVQLSLLQNLDASSHIRMGKALASVDWENLLVLGSGFSFHNLQAFFRPPTREHRQQNEAFEAWLQRVCTATDLPEAERRKQLVNWAAAPGARYSHPREEHLLPLHVCYGLAQSSCSERYEITVMNAKSSMYVW